METVTDAEVDRKFGVGPDSQLKVQNVSGVISVCSGDEQAISVHAVRRGSDQAIENTEIEMEQEGDRVTVHTRQRHQSGFLRGGGSMASVDYTISVPPDCTVEADGVSADVEITGPTARVDASTVSGSIRVDDVVDECRLNSVSGSINAARVRGSTELRSTSGGIEVRDSQLTGARCQTVSGKISIETPLTVGETYTFKTVSGSVRVTVPADTSVTIQMKSISGKVTSELPARVIKSGMRSWQGVVGDGGANLEMESVSGSLRVASNAGLSGGGSPGRPPETDAQREAREAAQMEILRSLSEGQLTVEDALKRLDNPLEAKAESASAPGEEPHADPTPE
jgi:hypothetical protein